MSSDEEQVIIKKEILTDESGSENDSNSFSDSDSAPNSPIIPIKKNISPIKHNKSQNTNETPNINLKHYKNKVNIQNYFNKKTHIVPNSKVQSAVHFLTENVDEEIFIIQCTKTIKLEDFIGSKINLNRKSILKNDDDKYEIESRSLKDKYSNVLLTGKNNKVLSLNTAGLVKIHEILDDVPLNVPTPTIQNGNILTSYPENLKIRHPLHGNSYESLIDLSEVVKDKLKKASDESTMASIASREKLEKKLSAQKRKRKNSSSPMKKKIKVESNDDNLDWISKI